MNPSQNTLQKWDARYLRLARMVASWSKDPSTQCGAVLVRPDKTLCSVGYNGFPRGAPDTPTLYSERSQKYPRIIHSEWNAIANARDPDVAGYTVYAWPMPPCNQCTGALIQKKISRFVQPQPSAEKLERWGVAFSYARKMLEQCNIEVSQPIVDDLFELDLPHFEIGTQVWHVQVSCHGTSSLVHGARIRIPVAAPSLCDKTRRSRPLDSQDFLKASMMHPSMQESRKPARS